MWYTIKSTEDWLSRLAARMLGDAMKWPDIYEVNKEVIGADPNRIRVGMKLWIPVDGAAKPVESSSTNTMATGNGSYSTAVVATPSVFNQSTTGVQTSPQGILDPNVQVIKASSPMNKYMIWGGAALAGIALLTTMLGKKKTAA